MEYYLKAFGYICQRKFLIHSARKTEKEMRDERWKKLSRRPFTLFFKEYLLLSLGFSSRSGNIRVSHYSRYIFFSFSLFSFLFPVFLSFFFFLFLFEENPSTIGRVYKRSHVTRYKVVVCLSNKRKFYAVDVSRSTRKKNF